MDFQPPEGVPFGSGNIPQQSGNGKSFYPRTKFPDNQDCSPLLREASPNKNYDRNGQPNMQNRNNSVRGKNQHYKPAVYNRLGNRNFQYRNNNSSDNAQTNTSNNGQRNFNRKRIGEVSTGPMAAKRKWVNKTPFYLNSNSASSQNHNSAQNRLNRIRNSNQHDEIVIKNDLYDNSQSNMSYNNESQELDAPDITVEVVNANVTATATTTTQEDLNVMRFKMILDAKAQSAIKMIQQKRKDKQVIFPFPVTPNVTGISLHERFTML